MINAKWLSEEEWEDYESILDRFIENDFDDRESGRIESLKTERESYESLAAQRELMKKHQYQLNGPGPHFWLRCVGCSELAGDPCTDDCAWAKQIDGFPREVDSDG